MLRCQMRVDQGFVPLNSFGEKGTEGIVLLKERCEDYYKSGVRIAKWRTQLECNLEMPTDVAVWENSDCIARAARICQANGLAFIAEIQTSQNTGSHSIERTAYVCEKARVYDSSQVDDASTVGMFGCVHIRSYSSKRTLHSLPEILSVFQANHNRDSFPASWVLSTAPTTSFLAFGSTLLCLPSCAVTMMRLGPALRSTLQMQRWIYQVSGRSAATTRFSSHRWTQSAAGAPPEMPENLRKIMDEYERRRAEEDAKQSGVWGILNSSTGALMGATCAGSILWLFYCLDDVSSSPHGLWAILFRERARRALVKAASWRLLPRDLDKDDPYLVIEPHEGLKFYTPVGLGPGIDTLAQGVSAFLDLGFGFVEVGPVVWIGGCFRGRQPGGPLLQKFQKGAPGLVCAVQELLSILSSLGPKLQLFVVDLASLPAGQRGEVAKIAKELVLKAMKLPGGGPRIFLRLPASWPDASASPEEQRRAAGEVAQAARGSEAAGIIVCGGLLGQLRQRNIRTARAYLPCLALATLAAAPLALSSLAFSGEKPGVKRARGGQLRCLACEEGQASLGSLRINFCGRPATGYTPVFYDDPGTNTASVNAGDYNLYVGGGAINLAFLKELGLPRSNKYLDLHKAMLKAASSTPGQLVASSALPGTEVDAFLSELGLMASFARVPAVNGPDAVVGAAFLDVLGPEHRPRSAKNVAMLYVVGPKGTGATGGQGPTVDSNAAFLQSVEEMAANALLAETLPRIQEVQFCLVSGGVYMHPESSKLDVAAAIVRGLRRAAETKAAPTVRFAYDSNSFEDAVGIEEPGIFKSHDDAAYGCQGTKESRRLQRELISEAFEKTQGDIAIIASGGLRNARDALDAAPQLTRLSPTRRTVEAGATVVQISTLLLEEGPVACRQLKDGMAQLLMQEGHLNLKSVVGSAVLRRTGKTKQKKRNPWKPKGT
eukprot:s699_g17.t1